MVVYPQPDLERFDVALRSTHVPLRGKPGVDSAVEHLPLARLARRKAYRQRVTDSNAVDIGLFDVDTDPKIVRVAAAMCLAPKAGGFPPV